MNFLKVIGTSAQSCPISRVSSGCELMITLSCPRLCRVRGAGQRTSPSRRRASASQLQSSPCPHRPPDPDCRERCNQQDDTPKCKSDGLGLNRTNIALIVSVLHHRSGSCSLPPSVFLLVSSRNLYSSEQPLCRIFSCRPRLTRCRLPFQLPKRVRRRASYRWSRDALRGRRRCRASVKAKLVPWHRGHARTRRSQTVE